MSLAERVDGIPQRRMPGPKCNTEMWLGTLTDDERAAFAKLVERQDLTRMQLWIWCREEGLTVSYHTFGRHLKHECSCL